MDAAEVVQITRDGVYVLLLIAAPMMVVAMIVGLAIALMQALTQIQEATLTFVPKLVAMLVTLVLTMPFMINTLIDYTHRLEEKIVHIE